MGFWDSLFNDPVDALFDKYSVPEADRKELRRRKDFFGYSDEFFESIILKPNYGKKPKLGYYTCPLCKHVIRSVPNNHIRCEGCGRTISIVDGKVRGWS